MMNSTANRVAALAAAAALSLTGAACGDDEEEGAGADSGAAEPATLAFEISGSAKKPTLTAPKSAKGGLVRIELSNEAQGSHGVQLIRAEEGHTPQEALAAGGQWGEKGRPLPPWAILAGGVGEAKAGSTAAVTQVLPAGEYAAVDLETDANTTFTVTGGGSGEVPTSEARIDAKEYGFAAAGLKAGKNQVLFDNQGDEPHFIAAAKIREGSSLDDVRTFFRTEKGRPPVDERAGFSTTVIEGGDSQEVELDLEKGRYALLCFIPDRKGGPPHVAKGMISEATVE